MLDPEGKERWRLEGYLPKDEFRAFLEMGLARLAMVRKNWPKAERRFTRVAENYPDSSYASQAVYFAGVSRYSTSHDHTELEKTAASLSQSIRAPNGSFARSRG
jgi:outer membrane protein assembly factor BamD (BamD/ComL family)